VASEKALCIEERRKESSFLFLSPRSQRQSDFVKFFLSFTLKSTDFFRSSFV
jgi:hypothetical protein